MCVYLYLFDYIELLSLVNAAQIATTCLRIALATFWLASTVDAAGLASGFPGFFLHLWGGSGPGSVSLDCLHPGADMCFKSDRSSCKVIM